MSADTPRGRCQGTSIYQAECPACIDGRHAGKPCTVCRGSASEPVLCWHCDGTGRVHLEAAPAP